LGIQTFNPGQGCSIGEAEVVGEEEEKGLVVGVRLEESGAELGFMLEMVVMTGLKIAQQ